jgi:hypothetical protein
MRSSPLHEIPKRLEPTHPTKRELYLKSGNRCAFPNCEQLIMAADGSFIAQICHIEAAEPHGERFNPNMSNEQRRSASNLMLMCYPHHVATNNVSIYSVDRLRQMKAAHEALHTNAQPILLQKWNDSTSRYDPTHVGNLARLNELLNWRLLPNELDEAVPNINAYVDKFRNVPLQTKQFLNTVVRRIHKLMGTPAVGDEGDWILLKDIEHAFLSTSR